MKQIEMKIFRNGEIEAETKDSEFTKDYFEIEDIENISLDQAINA